jgi:chromosomal replication initiation ATPase DnaA
MERQSTTGLAERGIISRAQRNHETTVRANRAAYCCAAVLASFFGCSVDVFYRASRGAAAEATARQVAMYVMNTALSFTQAEIGYAYGRDRTTVGHAIVTVEAMREDENMDTIIGELAQMIVQLTELSLRYSEADAA